MTWTRRVLLTGGLLLGLSAVSWAACTMHTYWMDGRMITCQTCGNPSAIDGPQWTTTCW